MKEIILQIANILIQSSLLTFSLISICRLLTNMNYSKKEITFSFLSILTSNILATLIKNVFPFGNSILGFIILFLVANCILKLSKLKSALLSLSNLILIFTSELISFYFISFIFKKTSLEISSNFTLLVLLIVIENILNFSTIILIINFYAKKYNSNISKIKFTNWQTFKIILLLLVAILPQMFLFTINKYSYSKLILFINSIQIIFFCLILFSYFKTFSEKEKAESELEISELHNKTMISMVDGVRTLKHDYNNIMQALNGYVSTKQYDKLQEHINKVLDECNIVNNLSVIDQKVFNDPAIYGIVGAKYFIAMEADIKFEFDIVTNIKEISFSMPELSRILGIILDNAIEATLKAENKYIRLEMKYDARKDADIIRVFNTYDKNIKIDLKEIYKKGVSSKKIKSGIGLWEVKKLIDKSKNSQIFASIEHDMFVQNIIIEKIIT